MCSRKYRKDQIGTRLKFLFMSISRIYGSISTNGSFLVLLHFPTSYSHSQQGIPYTITSHVSNQCHRRLACNWRTYLPIIFGATNLLISSIDMYLRMYSWEKLNNFVVVDTQNVIHFRDILGVHTILQK